MKRFLTLKNLYMSGECGVGKWLSSDLMPEAES